ncbi:MAG: riboflavin synthase [Candidatus Polarisedimenticolaceae bacterium]|nr:riboflavin synthase [Candidatus Polarisedimenticolaceae bacterium]
MFTGIIQAVGTLASIEPRGGDYRLTINSADLEMSNVALGDSIAVNGVCLTVIELMGQGFAADLSRETLSLTTLSSLTNGGRLNLEKALTLNTPLGGHMVSGHVDGIGSILKRTADARSIRFQIEAPADLARYIAHKGSITIDGTSLTVNSVDGVKFELNIVPHTLNKTIMAAYQVGDRVNLEVDLIARYLERLLLGDKAAEPTISSGVTEDFLAKHGFLR